MHPPLCPACRKPLTAGGVCPHCGHPAEAPPLAVAITPDPRPLPAPHSASAKLGQYRIVRELGRGGMGVVLEAVDEPLGRHVAVKLLLKPGGEEVNRQRFVEEARIAGCLEHPGIAPVYNLGRTTEGGAYFSMKLVAGRNLNEILADRQRGDAAVLHEFPLSRLLSVFERVVETVAYAHAQGILHRDLKPANVMVGAHGEVWVVDWGVAKVLGRAEPEPTFAEPPDHALQQHLQELTASGAVVGTPQYMAPEQARGHPLDVRADVFALGGILYKLLTGEAPNQGEDYMSTLINAALGAVPPVRTKSAGRHIPAALAAITEKCLAARADDRYASATDLLADLRAYAAGEGVKARPDGLVGKMARLARRHLRLVALAGTAAVLFLVGCTLVATLLAAKDRRALEAERQAQAAETARQAVVTESAARAQRRMRAFRPYAEATDLLLRGQQYDRAAELLEQTLKIDAEFPEAQFALGEALRLNGLPGRAASAYQRANELSRKISGRPHLQALLAAGMAFDGAGDYKSSEDAFRLAEREGAGHPLAQVGKAFRLAHERRLKDARTAADEALRLAPHLWETHFACGYLLAEQVDAGLVPPEPGRGQAIALMRKALELSPRQAEVLVWLSRTLLHTGEAANRAEAGRLFDSALALEPRNGNRYVTRGLNRQGSGDAVGAAADFQKARELGACRALLLHADALVAAQRGDAAMAFRLIGELIRETHDWPPHVANWLTLGFQLRRDDEVRGRFAEWCRKNPEYPEVYALKAQLKARDGDSAGAAAEDRAGLRFAPYNRKLRAQLARHLTEALRWPDALAAADAVLEVSPRDFSAQLIRVRCLTELARGEEARALLDRLSQEFPAYTREIDELRRSLAGRLSK